MTPSYTFREWFVGILPQVPTFPTNGHSRIPEPEREDPHGEPALLLFAEHEERPRVCEKQNVWLENHVLSENRMKCVRCGKSAAQITEGV